MRNQKWIAKKGSVMRRGGWDWAILNSKGNVVAIVFGHVLKETDHNPSHVANLFATSPKLLQIAKTMLSVANSDTSISPQMIVELQAVIKQAQQG